MHDKPSRMKRAAIGVIAGVALAIGAVTTSGFGLLATQPAAAFPLADGGVANADAGAAGSVQIQRSGSQLTIVSLSPAPGWTPEVERQTGREVEVDFRNDGRRVQLNVELEDGDVRVRVRDRADDGDDRRDDGDGRRGDGGDRRNGRGDDGQVDNSGPGHGGNDATDDSGPSGDAGPGNAGDSSDDGGSSGSGDDDGSSGSGNSGSD